MDDKTEVLEAVVKEAVDLVPKQSNPSLWFFFFFFFWNFVWGLFYLYWVLLFGAFAFWGWDFWWVCVEFSLCLAFFVVGFGMNCILNMVFLFYFFLFYGLNFYCRRTYQLKRFFWPWDATKMVSQQWLLRKGWPFLATTSLKRKRYSFLYIYFSFICLFISKIFPAIFFWYKWWTLSWLYNELNFPRLMKPKSFFFFFWNYLPMQQAEPVNKYSNSFFFFFFYLLWPFGYIWQFFACYRKVSFWSS